MGIINTIKGILSRRREEPRPTQTQEYISNERHKMKVQAIKDYERNSFLNPTGDWEK